MSNYLYETDAIDFFCHWNIHLLTMLVLFLLLRFFELKRCSSLAECYFFTVEIARFNDNLFANRSFSYRFRWWTSYWLDVFQSTLISKCLYAISIVIFCILDIHYIFSLIFFFHSQPPRPPCSLVSLWLFEIIKKKKIKTKIKQPEDTTISRKIEKCYRNVEQTGHADHLKTSSIRTKCITYLNLCVSSLIYIC